jgi:hypothetical protein
MEDLFDRKYKKFSEKKLELFLDIEITANDFKDFNTKMAIKELNQVIQWDKSRKVIKIDRATFLKGIAVEILAFKERINKQVENTKHIHEECDYTWAFVTEYYLSFFTITTLGRMNGEFSTYFYEEEAKEISEIATSYNVEGTPLKLNNGQYKIRVLSIDYDADEIEIELQFSKDTHATAWNIFSKFIKDYRELSGKKDTIEDNVVATIETYLSEGANIFSTLRNSLNYKYDKGFHKVDEINLYEKINWDSKDHEVQKAVLKLKKTSNDDDSIKDIAVFNRLLMFLVDKLFNEFVNQLQISK